MFKILKTIKNGSNGYTYALVPDHPNATKNGYVMEHRVVMENELGRLLENNEIVHHHNGIITDNRLGNLEVMTRSEHTIMHKSTGKTHVDLACDWCGDIFSREVRQLARYKGYSNCFCSRSCNGRFQRSKQLQQIVPL